MPEPFNPEDEKKLLSSYKVARDKRLHQWPGLFTLPSTTQHKNKIVTSTIEWLNNPRRSYKELLNLLNQDFLFEQGCKIYQVY